jgi:hypothetical protein
MSRRFLVGVGAWLLGAGIATTGSTIAVHELAHGLLVSQAQQLGAVATSGALTAGSASPDPTVAPSATTTAPRRHLKRPMVSASAALDSPTLTGTLLDSGDGSVIATCEAGGAYLLSWIPDQGFWAEDVGRGPAATAKVTFRGPGGGVFVSVTCPAGSPVAHLRQLSGDDGDDGHSGSPSAGPSGGSGE